jgi:hypothetical protein
MPTKSPEQLMAEISKFAPKSKEVRGEMEEAKERSKRRSSTWKPEVNKPYQLRVLPYIHSKSGSQNPFIEAHFHWNIDENLAYLVCPKTSDAANGGLSDECPICDLVKKLYSTKQPEDAALAKRIRHSLRWYAPIIVRGEEEKGVQFYGFSGKTYETFLSLIADSDYENIFDPLAGRDITLEYKKDEGSKKENDFGVITIHPRGKESAIIPVPANASEDEKTEIFTTILDIINSVPNFFEDVFRPKSTEELREIIANLVDSMDDEDGYSSSSGSEEKEMEEVEMDDDSDMVPPVDEDDDGSKKSVTVPQDESDDEKSVAERKRKLAETLGKFNRKK